MKALAGFVVIVVMAFFAGCVLVVKEAPHYGCSVGSDGGVLDAAPEADTESWGVF